MPEDIATLGLKVDSKQIKSATRALGKMDKQAGKTEKSAISLKGAFIALGGVAAMGAVLKATIEQEKAVSQLNATLKSTGGTAGFTSKEMQDMAAGLQKVTSFGDEAVISMQALLLTFTNIKGDTLVGAQTAVLNVATAMGTDLKSAAIQVGKALNDPILGITALSRSGITFSETQKDLIKGFVKTGEVAKAQAVIMGELETQFGGSAEAARKTLGGALASLKNAFGDLLEADGGVTGATDALEELTTLMQDPGTVSAFGVLTSAVIKITGVLAKAATGFADLGTAIGEFTAKALGAEIQDPLLDTRVSLRDTSESIQKIRDLLARPETLASPVAVQHLNDQLSELENRRGLLEGFVAQEPAADMAEPEIQDTATAEIESAIAKNEQLAEIDQLALADSITRTNEHFAELEITKLEHLARMGDMDAQARLDDLRFSQMTGKQKTKAFVGQLIQMTQGAATQSKAMFKINQAAAVANAVISGREAVQSAYAFGARYGGPAGGAAMAGLALAATAANIKAITSASFGGGGGGGGGGGATTPSEIGQSPQVNGVPVSGEAVKQTTIVLQGSEETGLRLSPQGMRDFADQFNDAVADGTVEVQLT